MVSVPLELELELFPFVDADRSEVKLPEDDRPLLDRPSWVVLAVSIEEVKEYPR